MTSRASSARGFASALLAVGLLLVAGAADALGAVRAQAQPHPQIRVGGFPTGIILDPVSGTIYVENGTSGSLSLIDGKTCNARDVRGCGQRVTPVTVGSDPVGGAVDPSTGTLYVASSSGSVAVVDTHSCDAATRSSCHVGQVAVPVGANPQFLAIDEETHTIYVANVNSNTLSVIDGMTCNAHSASGCSHPVATVQVGPGPFALAVNDLTHSIYVTDLLAHTVSIVDGATCNATDVAGCGKHPAAVDVGETPGGVAVDTKTDTVYVTGQFSDDVSVLDGATCNATTTRGCRGRPVRVLAGAGARGIAVDEQTNTVYVADTAADAVSVIDGATCNATVHSGCGQRAPMAPVGVSPRRIAIDETNDTIYVTNAGSNTVSVIDGATCSGSVERGCGHWRSVPPAAPGTVYRA